MKKSLFEIKKEIKEKISGNILVPQLVQAVGENGEKYGNPVPSSTTLQNVAVVDLDKLSEFLAEKLCSVNSATK